VEEVRGSVPVARACALMQLSPSGYYDWRSRGISKREQENQRIIQRIKAIHRASRGTYGAPRVHAELRAQGIEIGRRRVARLMQQEGIKALRRRKRCHQTPAAPLEAIKDNVLDRQFAPERPGAVWTADITYLPTAEGWLYLAVVIDLYSRRVVGWSARPSLAKELTTSALSNAIEQHRPGSGLIHHSDRGSQYTSYEYQQMLRRAGMTISMSRSGSCHDNAPTERFFGMLKTEMHLRGDPFQSHEEAKRGLFEYIEVFYNRQRRHSTLGYKTPVEFEEQYINQQTLIQ